jgi:hypothetical protein
LENILNIKIRDIVYVDYEETIQMTAKSKGIRLDIYVEDDDNTVFNLEMQTTTYKELPKRSRYYQGIIDLNMIEKGESYDILKESYVIFICTFDFFEKGRSVYEFENVCLEDSEIKLNDGTHKIFLNTKGDKSDINKELKSLLEYFDGSEPEKALTWNYIGNIDISSDFDSFTVMDFGQFSGKNTGRSTPIYFTVYFKKGRLYCNVNYDSLIYTREQMNSFQKAFLTNVQQLSDNYNTKHTDELSSILEVMGGV